MEKMGLIKNSRRMGKYELEQGYASYKTLVDYTTGSIFRLCAIYNLKFVYNYHLKSVSFPIAIWYNYLRIDMQSQRRRL